MTPISRIKDFVSSFLSYVISFYPQRPLEQEKSPRILDWANEISKFLKEEKMPDSNSKKVIAPISKNLENYLPNRRRYINDPVFRGRIYES